MIGLWQALRDTLSWRWNRSMVLLDIRWYDLVWICLQPNNSIKECQNLDSNCHPRSLVNADSTPNLEIYRLIKAWATLSAVTTGIGITSSYLVKWSIQVRRYTHPLEGDNSPTMSMWMLLNLVSSVLKLANLQLCVTVFLDFWHCKQHFAHFLISLLMHKTISNQMLSSPNIGMGKWM